MIAVLFDAFGTLLDIHSPARRLADRIGPDWQAFSLAWRTKQVEFTWVRTIANRHEDFDKLTEAALRSTLLARGMDVSLAGPLLAENARPDLFADVAAALAEIWIARAILSNGTPTGLAGQLSPIAHLLTDILSAETAGRFKPDPSVYSLATDRFSCNASDLAFVSSNPWDAFGALQFGFRVIWVNRDHKPDEYGLRGSVDEIGDLSALPALLSA